MYGKSLNRLSFMMVMIGLLSSLLGVTLPATPITTTGSDTVVQPVEATYTTYIEDSVQTSEETVPAFETQMPNPAAIYCEELGYDYTTSTNPFGGKFSSCQIDAETSCPAWDFLNGTCGAEYNACAQNDMITVVRTDGKSAYGQTYAECLDPTDNAVVVATSLVDMKITETVNFEMPTDAGSNNEADNSIQAADSLPAVFDWRNVDGQNWLSPVRDQGSCGSCWAFAAVGVVEAAANIDNNNANLDLDLAEQTMVGDCCTGCGNCTSGNHVQALYYMKNTGIPDEGCFPYQQDDSCGCDEACSDMNDRLHKIDSVNYLGTDPSYTVIKQALMEHGPMLGPLYHTSGGTWNNGVFSCSSSTSINHSVVLAGWDDNAGAWIVRNSWGEEWRDGGYYKVAYGTCAVERYLYYVDSSSQIYEDPAEPACYALNLNTSGNGSVQASPVPNCAGGYEQGTEVTLSATADANWVFSKWQGDVSGDRYANTVSLTMNSDESVAAGFVYGDEYEQICGLAAGNSYTFHATSRPVTIDVNALGNMDCIAVTRVEEDHPSIEPHIQPGFYWTLDATNDSGEAYGFTVSLTMQVDFLPSVIDSLCRYADGYWDCLSTSYSSFEQTITRASVTAFSDWAISNISGQTPNAVQTIEVSHVWTNAVPFAGALGLIPILWVAVQGKRKQNA